MVLDALGIDARCFGADAERAQKGFHRLVADAALLGNLAAGLGQEHAAIGFSGDQPLGAQPGQHLGHGRLGDAQPGRDIDLARLVAVLDQVGDQLDIVLDQRAAARFARLPEPFGMNIGVGKRLFASNRSVLQRQYALLLGAFEVSIALRIHSTGSIVLAVYLHSRAGATGVCGYRSGASIGTSQEA